MQKDNQEKYLTVTEVLRKYQNFNFVKQEDLDRGSLIHAWCEHYVKGLFIPKPEFFEGYCDSFQKWFDKNIEETLLCEERVSSDIFQFSGET